MRGVQKVETEVRVLKHTVSLVIVYDVIGATGGPAYRLTLDRLERDWSHF